MPLSRSFLPTAFLLPQPVLHHTALFHTAPTWRSERPSYYEILGVSLNASTGDIKKCAITYMALIACSCQLDNSTCSPRPTIQTIIPTTHKLRNALSRSQKLTPSLVARRSENAMIEIFNASRMHLSPAYLEAPIRVPRLLLDPDPQAG